MKRQDIDYYTTHCDGSWLTKLLFYLKNILIIIPDMFAYSIVHVHMASKWSFRRLSLILILAGLYRKKRVIHLHGAMFDIYYNNSSSVEKRLIKFVFSIADKVIVLSEEWQEKIQHFCNTSTITVIPNTVPLQAEKNYKKMANVDSPKFILFLGEIDQRKGVGDLIKAISYIEYPYKYKVLVCGTGDIQQAQLKSKQYGVEKYIEFTGWIDGREKQKRLKEAYIYVLPSYHEGLPMSILEAMASGIPVISTPVGGIPQVVKDGVNGFLVPPGSPASLANRIQKLMDNPILWKQLSQNAFATIKDEYSMEKTEKRLSNLYESLMIHL